MLASKNIDSPNAREGELMKGQWKDKGKVTWLDATVVASGKNIV